MSSTLSCQTFDVRYLTGSYVLYLPTCMHNFNVSTIAVACCIYGGTSEERTFCISTIIRVPDKDLDDHYHLV